MELEKTIRDESQMGRGKNRPITGGKRKRNRIEESQHRCQGEGEERDPSQHKNWIDVTIGKRWIYDLMPEVERETVKGGIQEIKRGKEDEEKRRNLRNER